MLPLDNSAAYSMKMSFKEPFFSTNSLMGEKIANMNVMHGVDNFKIAIQAVFSQSVFRMLLKA
jgi:hypothetical protein